MSAEERFLDAIAEEENEDEACDAPSMLARSREERLKIKQKNREAINKFIGRGRKTRAVIIIPRYYGELLAWAFQRHIERAGWRVIETLGYYLGPEPVYLDVSTDSENTENCLRHGRILLEKDENRLVATVDISLQGRNSIQVEAPSRMEKEIEDFITSIRTIVEKENFYRGKSFEYGYRHHFLKPGKRPWESIILSPEIKDEIRANTVGFLKKREWWSDYGIPTRRGIILAGQPGTGKTIVCKALMAEAEGMTCITTNAYGIDEDEYITELYEMAQDLSPSIVIIEDIDLIGQSRSEFGYQKGSALLSLLNVMDGIEENREIITVATTNCLDTLDKALGERPSRFDRVIKLGQPTLEQRREFIKLLGRKIPMDEVTQDYIARRSEYCTPAQLQEIVHGLVIEQSGEMPKEQSYLKISKDDIDSAISKINGRNGYRLGFNVGSNHNGGYPKAIGIQN